MKRRTSALAAVFLLMLNVVPAEAVSQGEVEMYWIGHSQAVVWLLCELFEEGSISKSQAKYKAEEMYSKAIYYENNFETKDVGRLFVRYFNLNLRERGCKIDELR